MAIAWLSERFLKAVDDSASVTVLTFLTAYASYIAAEQLHASGVLAVVACGLVMSGRQSRIVSAHSRTEARAVWEVVVFVLEALVFVVIGLSLHSVLARLGGDGTALWTALPLILAVNGAVIASRFLWVFAAAYAPGLNFLRRRTRDGRPPLSVPFVVSWAGMRGVVSLAPALALPTSFPGRDDLLLIAFTVILVTVLVQGTTLAAVIRITGLARIADHPGDMLNEPNARIRSAQASLRALEASARQAGDEEGHRPLIDEYRRRISLLDRPAKAPDTAPSQQRARSEAALSAIAAGRVELIRLHRIGQLHDSVLREMEHDLDLEELLLHRSLRLGPLLNKVEGWS